MNEKYLSERPCPVCKGRQGYALAQLRYALFDDLKMPGHKTLVQCHSCGMLYDDVRFSENQLQEYYRRNDHYAVSGTGGSGSVSKDNKARYDRIIELLKPGSDGVILDFGCGQGGFVLRCLEQGLEAAGIEPSTKSREVAKKAGLHVYESLDAFAIENPSCKIQTVVFSHIMEHLMNPIHLIRKLAKYANNALVYIEVPDTDSYLLTNNIRWREMYFEHLSHFRKHNLAELATHSGVEIINEGAASFSPAQQDVQCIFLLGHFRNVPCNDTSRAAPDAHAKFDGFPEVPGKELLSGDRPLALWGVSQYAMLLLGSNPWSRRLIRLFDSSPAKMGRSIGGVRVEHPDRISTLSKDTVIILPHSPFISQMKNILKNDIDYTGDVLEI